MYEVIADSVITMISDRRLQPGDPIVTEHELMSSFGAGRSSVREALRVLESKGVITGNRGSFQVANIHEAVSSSFELLMRLSGGSLGELHALRCVIEPAVARGAAEHRTDAQLEGMRLANARLERALALLGPEPTREEAASARDADIEFHRKLAEAAGNDVIATVIQAITETASRSFQASIAVPAIREAVHGQHEAIIEAVAAGDPDAAVAAVELHTRFVADSLGALLDRPLYL